MDVTSSAQVFYAADELVEIGGEGASLRLVAAQRPGPAAHASCTSATSPARPRARRC